MASPIGGGAAAVKSGKLLEEVTAQLCTLHGYTLIKHSELKRWVTTTGGKVIIKGYPYESIYMGASRGDAVMICGDRSVWIEAKRQKVSGSVDEKLPYVYENAHNIWAKMANDVVVVLHGDGFKSGAIPWLKRAAAHHNILRGSDAPIHVFSPGEFIDWVAQHPDLK